MRFNRNKCHFFTKFLEMCGQVVQSHKLIKATPLTLSLHEVKHHDLVVETVSEKNLDTVVMKD